MCTFENLGTYSGTSSNISALWCENPPTINNGACSLNTETLGECFYTTSCNLGYVIDGTQTDTTKTQSVGLYKYEPVSFDSSRIYAWINTNTGKWGYASDSYSIVIDAQPNTTYKMQFDTTDSEVVSSIFRVALYSGTTKPTSSGQSFTVENIIYDTLQDKPTKIITTKSDTKYLVVQVASNAGKRGDVFWKHFSVLKQTNEKDNNYGTQQCVNCVPQLLSCPEGQYIPANSITCTPCTSGSFCPGFTDEPFTGNAIGITACVAGSFSADSASVCTPCNKSKYNTGSGNTTCSLSCSNSEHVATWQQPDWQDTNTMSPDVCLIATCDTGYSPNAQHTACVANDYTITYKPGDNATGNNQPQSVQYMATFTTKSATTFRKQHATFVNWIAEDGTNYNASADYTYKKTGPSEFTAQWICNAGYYYQNGICTPCPIGTYKETASNDGINSCVPCEPGEVTPDTGSCSHCQCSHRLRVDVGDDGYVHLGSCKRTTPSLNVKINGKVYYGNMRKEYITMNPHTEHRLRIADKNDSAHPWYVYEDEVTCDEPDPEEACDSLVGQPGAYHPDGAPTNQTNWKIQSNATYIVEGIGYATNTSATTIGETTSVEQSTASSGNYCWYKMTSPVASPVWVFGGNTTGGTWCSNAGVLLQTNETFRHAIWPSIGTICDENSDEPDVPDEPDDCDHPELDPTIEPIREGIWYDPNPATAAGRPQATTSSLNTYMGTNDPVSPTWSVFFDYDRVSGISAITNTPGTSGATTSTDQSSAPAGNNCWCKMTYPGTSNWVYTQNANDAGACNQFCVEYMSSVSTRRAMYNTAIIPCDWIPKQLTPAVASDVTFDTADNCEMYCAQEGCVDRIVNSSLPNVDVTVFQDNLYGNLISNLSRPVSNYSPTTYGTSMNWIINSANTNQMTGKAYCVNKAPTQIFDTTYDDLENAPRGNYCWCKMTGYANNNDFSPYR